MSIKNIDMNEVANNTDIENKSGYKKTKLGWIPEDWYIVKLSNVIELESGQHLSPEEYNGNKKGFPYFTGPTDFCNSLKNVKKWTIEGKKFAINGDVLITVKGSGVGTLYISDLEKVAIGRQLMAIRPQKVVQEYIYNYLLQKKRCLEALASGNMIPGLSRKDILNFKIPVPPLPEQKKIAEILSTWDRAIDTLEQLIAKKEELKRGLMQQLLTGKKRFTGFEGEWKVIKLNKLITTFSGGTPSRSKPEYYNGTIPWIKSGELNTRRIFNTEEFINEEGLKNSSAKLVNKNTLLLAIYGATAGVISVNMMEEATLNQAVLALIPKNNKIDQGFLELWFLFKKDRIVHTFTQGGQPNLSAKIVKSLNIECPDLEEQRKISKLIFSISDEIEVMKKTIHAFEIQKKGLMQQLLTGKTRVTI